MTTALSPTRPDVRARSAARASSRFGPILVLWGISLAIFPAYLLPPAGPQVSDLIVAALMGLVFTRKGIEQVQAAVPVLRAFGWFAWYVLLVAVYRTIQTSDGEILLFAFFYAFNVLRLMLAVRLYSMYGRDFLRMTAYGVIAAVGVVTVVSLGGTLSVAREQLLFNNPNQLGYFAVLAPIIILQVSSVVRVPWYLQALAYLGSLWAAALSLSKAAALALAAFGVIAVLRRNLAFLVLALALIVGYSISDPNSILVERVQQRFAPATLQADDTWAGRGYDRIINHPDYLILGAGEGAVYRFISENKDAELHSSWGTLLFAYGVPGSLLFMAGILAIYRTAGLVAMLSLTPVVLYSLSHQGMRFPLFWVVLAVLLCAGHARAVERGRAAEPVPAVFPPSLVPRKES